MNDYSNTDLQMQTQTDPYPGSVTSRPTSLQGELERIRYAINAIKGTTYWYQPPNLDVNSFLQEFNVHDHSGVAGHGPQILTNGIATNAVQSDQIAGSAVDEGKIVSTTFSGSGGIIGGSSTKVYANVDNSTLEINGTNQIQVKALGITNSQILNLSGAKIFGAGTIDASVLTGTITPSDGTVTTAKLAASIVIPGTATNDNAAAGKVGEYIESVVGPVNFAASGSAGDITSISLTAGDWEVTASIISIAGTVSTSSFRIGVSTTSGNSLTGLVNGSNYLFDQRAFTAGDISSLTISGYRASLAGTTVHYLKGIANYGGTTPAAYGRISARRMR
jgi:hypothetical protein